MVPRRVEKAALSQIEKKLAKKLKASKKHYYWWRSNTSSLQNQLESAQVLLLNQNNSVWPEGPYPLLPWQKSRERGAYLTKTLPGVLLEYWSANYFGSNQTCLGPESHPTRNDEVEPSEGKIRFRWMGRSDFVINSVGVKLILILIEQKAAILIHQFFPWGFILFGSLPDDSLGQN